MSEPNVLIAYISTSIPVTLGWDVRDQVRKGRYKPQFVVLLFLGILCRTATSSARFNILFILGAAALAAPYEVPAEIGRLDIWVMLAATSLLILFGWTGYRLSRVEGVILLSAYLAYVVYLIIGVTAG